VHVRVDPTGQHRQAAQVIVHRPRDLRIYRNNLCALDHDPNVMKYVTPAIDHHARGNYYGLWRGKRLCGNSRRQGADANNAEDAPNHLCWSHARSSFGSI
jgi:hypothetical protein